MSLASKFPSPFVYISLKALVTVCLVIQFPNIRRLFLPWEQTLTYQRSLLLTLL